MDDEEQDEMATDGLVKQVQKENQLDLTADECEEQDRARLMHRWQQHLQQQQQEAAEARAFARQQQRQRSDPFAAYNLFTPRQQRQHEPLFSSLSDSPLGGWVSQPRRSHVAQPWTTRSFGNLASPMMLF